MTSPALIPSINYPTRITDHSATLIDNIISNFTYDANAPIIIISDISDRFPIMLWFANESATTVPNQSRTSKPVNDTLIGHNF